MEKLPLNAVKCNLTKLTTKRSSCHSSGSQCFLDVSVGAVQPIIVACLSMVQSSGFSWELLVILPHLLLPLPPHALLFPCESCMDNRWPALVHCHFHVTAVRMTVLCGGSQLGCRDCQPWQLFTEQGLDVCSGHRHPSSMQHDAVVNL